MAWNQVIPAHAGIQKARLNMVDSGMRRNDEGDFGLAQV